MYKSDHFSSFADIITHKSSLMCVIKIINGPIITYFFPHYFRHLMCVGMLRRCQKVLVCIWRSLEIFENLLLRGLENAALFLAFFYVNFPAVMFIPYNNEMQHGRTRERFPPNTIGSCTAALTNCFLTGMIQQQRLVNSTHRCTYLVC